MLVTYSIHYLLHCPTFFYEIFISLTGIFQSGQSKGADSKSVISFAVSHQVFEKFQIFEI